MVCHPHPLYGGDLENPVVVRTVEVARECGVQTLRLNFRGVGRSTGSHAKGEGEREDVTAALELIRSRTPAGQPLGVAGYSFGAWVSAQVASETPQLASLCLIAPPLGMFDFAALDTVSMDTLVVAGTQDPYCPAPRLAALSQRRPGIHAVTIEGADHFFFGKLFPLGEAIRSWVNRWAAGRPEPFPRQP